MRSYSVELEALTNQEKTVEEKYAEEIALEKVEKDVERKRLAAQRNGEGGIGCRIALNQVVLYLNWNRTPLRFSGWWTPMGTISGRPVSKFRRSRP
jgi:hypothetical protein